MGRSTWLVLALALGCEDAPPKPPARTRAPAAGPAATTNLASKLDTPPLPVADKDRLRPQPRGGELVIDSPGKWDKSCRIHRACGVTPRTLPRCEPGQASEVWSTLPGRAEHFTDPHVSVKGRLVMSDGAISTAVSCAKGQCCNGRYAQLVLAGPPYDLELHGLGCGGDESRLCCELSALGEEVIATGVMSYSNGRLLLTSPELCRVE